MSDESGSRPGAESVSAGEGDGLVVTHHRFGFAHAAVLAGVALLSFAAWVGTGGIAPEQAEPDTAAFFNAFGSSEDLAADAERLRRAFVRPTPPKAAPAPPPDPHVDRAFAALDRADVKKLDAFIAAYAKHDYAVYQGYVAQAARWREAALWQAEEARHKKEQRDAEWSYD